MGKYLKEFELTSQYEEYINSTMALLPNVSLTNDDNMIHYNPEAEPKNYLTIEALEDDLTVSLSVNACEYCIDEDGDWKTLNAGTPTESINAGQTISFRGNLTPKSSSSSKGIGTFTISKKCNVLGNVMSMLFGDDGKDSLSLIDKPYAFYKLFYNCSNIISAKYLYLPATELTRSCYESMFQSCRSLTTAPALPATELTQSCYENMFQYCTSLTTAPALPATTLARECYECMFWSCRSLTTAPTLPATTLAYACYSGMFTYCSSLTTAPELPATTLADYCYNSMFSGCTSLTTAPELPATTLAYYCYNTMFSGCTSLTTAPELPATTLADYCYNSMFSGCTSLTTAPELPATTLTDFCYQNMFSDCTGLTTAPVILPATTLTGYCYSGMFFGCTSLVTAPVLPATTLAYACYGSMFKGCTSLNYIKMLATDISTSYCLGSWVQNVASTGTFVKHPNMTSLPTGVDGIPEGWIVDNISPCIINQTSESITFVYSDGLFTPTNKIIDLSQYFTKEELLSIQPECEIIVTLQDKTDNVLASEYVWTNDKTLGDVLNELDVTKDVYDINVFITKVNAPEDNGYYYYTLDETEPFVEKDWMRIVSLEDDNTISLAKDIQYSINGDDWRNLNAGNTITVKSDDIVYFKGNNIRNQFFVNKAFNVEGNVMSLLYGDNFEGQIDLSGKDYAFNYLFYYCTTLKNAENLILPATTLAEWCYTYMFQGCTSLTTAPELPAITLAESCYGSMFFGCTSLTTAPELPATTLALGCYSNMFQGCTSLTTAPELPATTLDEYCYQDMFQKCTSLTIAPELPATELAEACYQNMFYGCTSLTTAPELPANTLGAYCYASMFYNCTSLTTAPELPANTLVYGCYNSMFNGCEKLNNIKMLATVISTYGCLYDWVKNVASIGTFIKHPDMTSLPTGVDGIPSGWTVQDAEI